MRARTRCLNTFWVGIVSTSFSFDEAAGLTLSGPPEKGGQRIPEKRVLLCPIDAGGVSAGAGFGAGRAVQGAVCRARLEVTRGGRGSMPLSAEAETVRQWSERA